MKRVGLKQCNPAGAALAAGLAVAIAAGVAQAQQGPRYGLAPAVSAPPVALAVLQPRILIRSHPVYVSSGYYRATPATHSTPPVHGPYLTGPGQWVPGGSQAMALQWEPGDTLPSPAAPSGHWDWKRTSLAELVEMSRRNKASRGTD